MLQAKWTIRNAELSAALCTSLFTHILAFNIPTNYNTACSVIEAFLRFHFQEIRRYA